MFKKSYSKAEMKVLGWLASADGEAYERQIAEGAGVSAGSANEIMRQFCRSGLAKKTVRGRMSFYRSEAGHPLLRQFRIFLMVADAMPFVEAAAPLCRRILMLESARGGVDLLILTREKDMVRGMLPEYPHIRALIMDATGYASLRQRDPEAYAKYERGVELYYDGG